MFSLQCFNPDGARETSKWFIPRGAEKCRVIEDVAGDEVLRKGPSFLLAYCTLLSWTVLTFNPDQGVQNFKYSKKLWMTMDNFGTLSV